MSKPVWAIPIPIRIKATGEVGRLELIYYDYSDGDDLLYVRLDDGRTVRVMGTNAEHAAQQDKVQP